MTTRRFRAWRPYTHTRVWAITAAILIIAGLLVFLGTGRSVYPVMAIVIGAAGLAWSTRQDLGSRLTYGIEAASLLMRRERVEHRIALEDIQDVSLVDRLAARELLVQRMREMEEAGMIPAERDAFQRQFTRWCTRGIGPVSGAIWFTRAGRPDGRHDLVLLRLMNGRSLLLSPIHAQDMVSALNKGLTGMVDQQRDRA